MSGPARLLFDAVNVRSPGGVQLQLQLARSAARRRPEGWELLVLQADDGTPAREEPDARRAAVALGGVGVDGEGPRADLLHVSRAGGSAVFTSNQVKGAPVLVSQQHIRGGEAQAILASSGCSNVCTGPRGLEDAREMTRRTGQLLGVPPERVLIAATGVIGQPLPMERVRAALPKLVKALSPQGGRGAAEAIMTTDTLPKEAAVRLEVAGRPVTIGGIAKGVGMVEPHLATMFCFVTTDAARPTRRPRKRTGRGWGGGPGGAGRERGGARGHLGGRTGASRRAKRIV